MHSLIFFFLWRATGRGFSLKGLLCIPRKRALSEMDTWLTEHSALAFLPSQPSCSTPQPLDISGERSACWEAVWDAATRLVASKERWGGAAAQGPRCLPSLLGAFRSFGVCSAGYCRFIKPQWLQHNARQERGRG